MVCYSKRPALVIDRNFKATSSLKRRGKQSIHPNNRKQANSPKFARMAANLTPIPTD